MKPISIAYVPPPSFPGAEAFLRNVREWKTVHPLILFSDHDYGDGVIKLRGSPESIQGATYADGRKNKWALNNYVWLTALRILKDRPEFTHMLWLESDSRVLGHGWDEIIFDEALSGPEPPLLAGSSVCYSPCNAGMEFTKAWQRFLADNVNKPFPIPAYGGNGAAESHKPVVFPNGSLAVFDIAWISSHFDLTEQPEPVKPIRDTTSYNLGGVLPSSELGGTKRQAAETTAFDYRAGQLLYAEFGYELFKKIRHLTVSYSSYGEIMTSVMERRQMLLDGKIVAYHQEKTDWFPDVKVAPKFIGGVGAMRMSNAGSVEMVAPLCAGSSPAAPTITGGALQTWIEAADTVADTGTMDGDAELTYKPKPPRVDILLVSYAKDAEWAHYCVTSIRKFCKCGGIFGRGGFSEFVMVVPTADKGLFTGMRAKLVTFEEAPPPKGHLHHLIVKCNADRYCPHADFILYVDSDCIFHEATTAESYLVDGKPVLVYEPWDVLRARNDRAMCWYEPTKRALGFEPYAMTMCRHPSVYPRQLLPRFREHVSAVQGKKFEDYVFSVKPAHPNLGFSEFCSIGAFAWEYYHGAFHWIDISKEPRPKELLTQFWSRSPLDKPQDIWVNGERIRVIPIDEIKQVLE